MDIYTENAIKDATAAVADTHEFRAETYLAILLAKLLQPRNTAAARASAPEMAGPPTSKAFSSPELFARTAWTTDNDRVVLAGYFLERYAGKPNYSTQEMKDCLLSAKVPTPKNTNVAIIRCIGRGWMMEVTGGASGKRWSLTQSGERYAEGLMKKNGED
ncbi:MAG: hypothetical protein WA876_14385 [Candidatus Acidiferrales bacterium]